MLRRSGISFYGAFVASGASTATPQSLNDVTLNFRRTEEAARRAEEKRAKKGFFSLPNLMYPVDRGISPVMSARQVAFIRNVYHQDAVDTLNNLSIGSEFEGHPLDVIIRSTSFDAANSALHSAASEHFNHSFFFRSISPFGAPMPQSVANAIHLAFSTRGTREDSNAKNSAITLDTPFEQHVMSTALNHQAASGWLYLLKGPNGLEVRVYNHGTCPLSGNSTPLLCINLHDHAYCLDYESGFDGTANYVHNCLRAINWNTPQRYLSFAEGSSTLDLLAFDQ